QRVRGGSQRACVPSALPARLARRARGGSWAFLRSSRLLTSSFPSLSLLEEQSIRKPSRWTGDGAGGGALPGLLRRPDHLCSPTPLAVNALFAGAPTGMPQSIASAPHNLQDTA